MSETKKILFQPEFEYYHSLLSAHGESLIENFKQKLMTISYDESSRVLEFGKKNETIERIVFTDDGSGNVIVTLYSSSIMTDDGNGNVTVTNVILTDTGNGNVYIS